MLLYTGEYTVCINHGFVNLTASSQTLPSHSKQTDCDCETYDQVKVVFLDSCPDHLWEEIQTRIANVACVEVARRCVDGSGDQQGEYKNDGTSGSEGEVTENGSHVEESGNESHA